MTRKKAFQVTVLVDGERRSFSMLTPTAMTRREARASVEGRFGQYRTISVN